mmetsp:Transcript_22696/g.68113  ORF Transcript_22696/g.68113 Transcript_22696/m.68113 type:complete len:286 (+) Transcript_22696:78-935(+)|eukprot:CAMPEP_0119259740 /NCGR_PEP_ID=MMETSP1329-20130426/439_1 /TAXON_ID=114041 /ORGANISM="Genus nov. species nov., Strain RCC1024" /LENGTH=285 /DNA_ID=CAMNT_0007259141 /DNA_START=56 /DNA_END=913 /DNA_ORIENTATION=-
MSRLLFALMLSGAAAFRGPLSRVPKMQKMAAAAVDADSLKRAVAPAEIGSTSQAVYSWVGLAVGAAGVVKPELVAQKLLGVASGGNTDIAIRGASLAAMLLGARVGRESDSAAAGSAALWLGAWAYMLRGATGVAARTQTACALLALSAVRRSGGLYNFVTTLDTDGLSAILPTNRDLSMQNVVGMQAMAWGFGLLFAPQYIATNLMGSAAAPAIVTNGLAINNLVLGGKIMSGSESDARNNGLLFFGGWTAIMVMARNAGLMSGQYAVPCLAWNAACAAYSLLA